MAAITNKRIIEIFEDFAKESTRIDQSCIMEEDWKMVCDEIVKNITDEG